MATEAEITGNCVHHEVYERQLPAAYRLGGGWQHRLARRGGSYRLLRNGPAEPPQTHATLPYRAVSPSIMNSREFKGIQGNSREFRGIQGNSREFKGIFTKTGETRSVGSGMPGHPLWVQGASPSRSNGPAEPPQTHATLLYRAVSPSIMNSREFP